MKDWTSINTKLPKVGQFVITSVRKENYIYHEILKIDEKSNKWVNHEDVELNSNINVIAWMDLPSIFLN